ncbi:MAG: universal stress protein [Nitrospirota bacterium]|nr:universal stress protein [Nitrospirota bacterium]MDH5699044.1 universal stress protein [Nitrospirota bacterium]
MKILVAVDPSQHAQEAIRFVSSVDWPKASEIYLIHVIEMKHASTLIPSDGPSSWDRVISQARGKMVTEARLFLEQTKQEILKESSHIVKTVVLEGLPGAEILQAVEDYRIDLVILGTRGLSNVKRFLLGSTSDWVMREAPCSVLLVREKLSKVTMGKTAAKILLATDGSSVALSTVDMLGLLTCKTPPKVTVTHVVGRPAYLEGWYWGKGKAAFTQLAEQLQTKAQKDGASYLEEMSQRVKDLGMQVDTVLTKGDPAEEIVKIAERSKAKLIMVGSKGFIGGKLVPLGGVVRKIARYAPCSVLLTRPGRSEKEG